MGFIKKVQAPVKEFSN